MSNNEMSCVAQSPEPRSIDRRGFLRRVAMGVGASALALAAVKPALADTIINRDYVSVSGDKLAKTATCVVGKSGAVDFLTDDYASDDLAIQAAINDTTVGSTNRETIVLKGNFTIENTVTMKSGIVLSGKGAQLSAAASLNDYLITIPDNAQLFEISGMRLYANPANNTSAGCIKGDGTSYGIHDFILHDLWIAGYNTSGLFLDNVSHFMISHIMSDSSALGTMYGDYCIYISNAIEAHLNDIIYERATNGMYLGGLDRSVVSNITSSHANYETGADYGLIVSGCHESTFQNIVTQHWEKDSIRVLDSYGNVLSNIIAKKGKEHLLMVYKSYENVFNNMQLSDCEGAGKACIYVSDDGVVLSQNNIFCGGRIDTAPYGIYEGGSAGLNIFTNLNISNCTTPVDVGTNSRYINIVGYNPVGNFTAPSVPATTVNYTNAYGYPCQVLISGGTVTEIDLDDIATGLTSGIFVIAPGETINITYSSAPTWKWWGL